MSKCDGLSSHGQLFVRFCASLVPHLNPLLLIFKLFIMIKEESNGQKAKKLTSLINVRVPGRVDNPHNLVKLLGGPDHIASLSTISLKLTAH